MPLRWGSPRPSRQHFCRPSLLPPFFFLSLTSLSSRNTFYSTSDSFTPTHRPLLPPPFDMKPFSAPWGESLTGIPLVVMSTLVSGLYTFPLPPTLITLFACRDVPPGSCSSGEHRPPTRVAIAPLVAAPGASWPCTDWLFAHSDMIRVLPMVSSSAVVVSCVPRLTPFFDQRSRRTPSSRPALPPFSPTPLSWEPPSACSLLEPSLVPWPTSPSATSSAVVL